MPDDDAITINVLDFRNIANYGIYATSKGISARGNTLDFLARDYNLGNAVQTRNVLSLRPEGNVGIGTNSRITNRMLVHQGSSGTTGATSIPLRISAGAYSDAGNGTATLIGFATQNDEFFETAKCAIGHCRTASFDRGSIVFLCNNVNDSNPVTMSDERMRITSGGNVGIGTATVNHKLHVEGTTRLNGTIYYGNDTWHSDVSGNKKIWYATDGHTYLLGGSGTCFTFRRGDEAIIAEMYSTGAMYILGSLSQGSDSRIKTNIKDIDDDEALNLILAIEPKTYEYIDKKRGSDTVYGFIAQQVKEVIPRAIQIVSDILPNIYKICECEGDIIYCSIPQDVSINTEIRLIDIDDKEVVHKILEIGEDYIRIDSVLEVNNVFVFGYNVDNFHRMSKEYIYTLNVCATQILSRKIEAQSVVIKSYDDRIKDLETKVAMLLSSNTT